MYNPSQPTAAEAAAGYVDSDFEYAEVYNRSSSPVVLDDYYVGNGIGYTPGWLPDGSLANDFGVSSITGYPLAGGGTTATVTIDSTSTGFQNGDEIHIDGAASAYDGDFAITNVIVNAAAGTTTFTYTMSGLSASPATPVTGQALTAGKDSEFETLASGATATWTAAGLAASTYTVYAHLNLYDGENNPLTDLDSQAQYTVTCGGVPTMVTIDQNQVPATLSVTGLTYDNGSGLVTATADNAVVDNGSLAAGSIVHVSGATPSQYDGTFVVQSANASGFTYALAGGLDLDAATGTITAGLNDVRISLGTFTTSGTVTVELTRTTAASPGEWTVAGGMDLVSSQQQTTVLGTPTFGNTNSLPTLPATLAPGQYAVIVSNYAAFEERYNPTGTNNILVLGVYTGHLNNGGDTVDIYQVADRAGGDVTALNGYVPFYRVDHVSYNNVAPWPLEPDGNGPALIRINTADYGNDASNWQASNADGTPGAANLAIDTSTPSTPMNLAAQGLLSPAAGVSLTWNTSTDAQSYVAYYEVYRNGAIDLGSALAVTSLTRSGNTATATLASASGFAVGEYVTISGAQTTGVQWRLRHHRGQRRYVQLYGVGLADIAGRRYNDYGPA